VTGRRKSDVRAENEALRAELARVYRALAEANSRIRSQGSTVPPHWFGEYLLRQEAA
jgi:hypothetical protein